MILRNKIYTFEEDVEFTKYCEYCYDYRLEGFCSGHLKHKHNAIEKANQWLDKNSCSKNKVISITGNENLFIICMEEIEEEDE
jgi:hypothetical protein